MSEAEDFLIVYIKNCMKAAVSVSPFAYTVSLGQRTIQNIGDNKINC